VSDQGAVPPGWYPDPGGRFEHRYFNGVAWTGDVSIDGRRYVDDGSAPLAASTEAPTRRATVAMVVGIVAATVAWMPMFFVVGVAGGITAIALGRSVRRRARRGSARTFATVGVVAGAAALLLSIVGTWFTVAVYRAVDAYQRPARHATEISHCAVDGGVATMRGTVTNLDDHRAGFTLRVEFTRPGTIRTLASATDEIGDVEAGASTTFEIRRVLSSSSDEVDCGIARVDGPLPFGLDIG
jgi:hypothetical protein